MEEHRLPQWWKMVPHRLKGILGLRALKTQQPLLQETRGRVGIRPLDLALVNGQRHWPLCHLEVETSTRPVDHVMRLVEVFVKGSLRTLPVHDAKVQICRSPWSDSRLLKEIDGR